MLGGVCKKKKCFPAPNTISGLLIGLVQFFELFYCMTFATINNVSWFISKETATSVQLKLLPSACASHDDGTSGLELEHHSHSTASLWAETRTWKAAGGKRRGKRARQRQHLRALRAHRCCHFQRVLEHPRDTKISWCNKLKILFKKCWGRKRGGKTRKKHLTFVFSWKDM